MRKPWGLALAFTIASGMAQAQTLGPVYPCSTVTDKSGTYQAETSLFDAVPQGQPPRAGMFVQCLTASCTFALNVWGTTASLTAGPSFTINGQYGFYNAASFGFVPQKAVRIVASASSTIVAFACPY